MRRLAVVVIVGALLVLSGCPQGEPAKNYSGSSISYVGSLNASEDGFSMNGRILNSGQTGDDPPTFRNVTVYLYTENGTLIKKKEVGDLKWAINVSLKSARIPEYVIFNSPDFWKYEDTFVSYYELDGEIYGEVNIDSKNEYPVDKF